LAERHKNFGSKAPMLITRQGNSEELVTAWMDTAYFKVSVKAEREK
jgi:hypothetical protein